MIVSNMISFLPNSMIPLKILCINTLSLVDKLMQKIPNAEISLVLSSKELLSKADFYSGVIKIYEADFTKDPLPFPHETFDYIIADRVLEQMENAQDMALAMFFWLKEDGCLLTSFRNRKYGSTETGFKEHQLGRRQGYSLEEVENLLRISFYKEFSFGYSREENMFEDFVPLPNSKGGLSDENSNAAAVWLVAAYRSTFETAFLKRQYTKAVRQRMACLLRRVAYNVEREVSCAAFWALCEEESVKASYVAAFIESTMVDPPAVFSKLGDWAMLHQKEQSAMDLLDASLQGRAVLFADEKLRER